MESILTLKVYTEKGKDGVPDAKCPIFLEWEHTSGKSMWKLYLASCEQVIVMRLERRLRPMLVDVAAATVVSSPEGSRIEMG